MDRKNMLCLCRKASEVIDGFIQLLAATESQPEEVWRLGIDAFISQRLIKHADSTCSAAAIHREFVEWWKKAGYHAPVPSQKRLGRALRHAGYARMKSGGRIVWGGAAIKPVI